MVTELRGRGMDRNLTTVQVARVTEGAAVAAARLRGRGDEVAADLAAVQALRDELNKLPIQGRVVIGEGALGDTPFLFIGEIVGNGGGPEVDIAVDALEGTTPCAKALPNALAVVALAERGTLLNVPDIYMDKIAIGPGYAPGLVDLDATPSENLQALANAKGVPVGAITACVLDRPRHAKLIEQVREAGAALRLIGDGDIAGVIHTTDPQETGIDIYLGVGGAPEGVLAAAALRCIGGQMQGRLHVANEEHRRRAQALGIEDMNQRYLIEDMVRGDVIFAATGVTDGSLLSGVRFTSRSIQTETLVTRAATCTVRWIKSEHHNPAEYA